MSKHITTADDVTGIIHDQADRLFHDLISTKLLDECARDPWPADIWTALEESGLPLALVPEPRGGIGLPMSAVGGLLALTGYHAVPLPLAEDDPGAGALGQRGRDGSGRADSARSDQRCRPGNDFGVRRGVSAHRTRQVGAVGFACPKYPAFRSG